LFKRPTPQLFVSLFVELNERSLHVNNDIMMSLFFRGTGLTAISPNCKTVSTQDLRAEIERSIVLLMTDNSPLHDELDQRMISRRELLQAIGVAAVAIPAASLGQTGARAGRGGAPRDTTPLVPPFAATGWKTVWLDHLSYRCADYEKAAAFYVGLMGWKVRS